MARKMTIFGIGDKAGIPTLVYLGLSYWLTVKYPSIFSYPDWNLFQAVRIPKGIFLLVVGGIVLILTAGHLLFSYSKGRLAKTGFYHLVSNPLYANAVVLLIPGLSLVLNSWLILTASVVLYVLYRYFIHEEYDYLREKFGEEYDNYYKKILIKWL